MKVLTTLLTAGTMSLTLAAESPYRGEEAREIKALSPQQVTSLLAGEGMGFAMAAELNQYPGPKHVLELANALNLSEDQLENARREFESMKASAIELGRQLVEQERELDRLFASQEISAESLKRQLLQIGETRARLRGIHLQAHLNTRAHLTSEQIRRYEHLRGYAAGPDHNMEHH